LGQQVRIANAKARLCSSDHRVIVLSRVIVAQFFTEEPMNSTKFEPFAALNCQNADWRTFVEGRVIVVLFRTTSRSHDFCPACELRVTLKVLKNLATVICASNDNTKPVPLAYQISVNPNLLLESCRAHSKLLRFRQRAV